MNIRTTTLVTILAGALGSVPAAASERSTPTATPWTPASLSRTLADMPFGDIDRGAQINKDMMCASCHGANGTAPTANWPNVAGQKADYTYKILLDYKVGRRAEDRRSELMATLTQIMSEQDMADVAAYYANLDPRSVREDKPASSDEALARAEKLVRKGDRSRLITPCASCHGLKGQGGINAAPSLAGQSAEAFNRTMQMYKTGRRHNDVNASMSQFAAKLSDEEISRLAEYYSTL